MPQSRSAGILLDDPPVARGWAIAGFLAGAQPTILARDYAVAGLYAAADVRRLGVAVI
jgi:hypothetical protein